MPFSLHGFPALSRRRFPALPCGVIAGYPMQTVMRFSRCGAGFGNKKSPHNNLNLTTPSGMALVRVCYVAIRKSKTCSGSSGSRAGTLNKYVILNCWDRLAQKSSRVNKKFCKYDALGSLQEKSRETLVKRERMRQLVLFDMMYPTAFIFVTGIAQKGGHLHPCRQPPLVLRYILFSQSLKILSSSLSMVPALANSSVSA